MDGIGMRNLFKKTIIILSLSLGLYIWKYYIEYKNNQALNFNLEKTVTEKPILTNVANHYAHLLLHKFNFKFKNIFSCQ